MKKIHVILLVGGQSIRFNNYDLSTIKLPKSLGLIDKDRLIIHVMRNFFVYNMKNFILPLGYFKNEFIKFFKKIKNIDSIKCNIYFNSYDYIKSSKNNIKNINILLYDTGLNKNKAERISIITRELNLTSFVVSYGDGIGNVNLTKIYKSHLNTNCYVTGVGMILKSQYGHYKINKANIASDLIEKPLMKNLVNIGYFFFKKEALEYLYKYKHLDLESGVLRKLAMKKKICVYEHKKFWKSVDTLKDLNDLKNFFKKKSNK